MAGSVTLAKFFSYLQQPVVHPSFDVLKVTGRTSSRNPNLQNCLSGDTELLTSQGWVRFDTIDESNQPAFVAQFDPEDGSISFAEPEKWVEQQWSKDLVSLTGDHVDLLATHDHRCLLYAAGGDRSRVFPAADYPAGDDNFEQPHAGMYPGGTNDSISQDLLAYFIAFQADGTWAGEKDNQMAFHISREDKLTKLYACLKALRAKYTAKKNPNSGSTHIVVPDPQLTRLTAHYLGPNKLYGSWLLGLPRERLDFFADEIWNWDGEKDRQTGYCSQESTNADWVQIVCLLSGRRAQVRDYENTGGRKAKIVDHTADALSSPCSEVELALVRSPGKVYCVTVPTGFILVRRGGKAAIVGNCPRDADFRRLFVARPGHLLLTTDYSAIELRTLAAICKQRFGFSHLAEVISQGKDPHAYTASLIIDEPYETVVQGCKAEEAAIREAEQKGQPRPATPYSKARQSAKACNFGLPGGLGPPKLVLYAKTNYGVVMSLKEAEAFRQRLITDIYPELALYLVEDLLRSLSWTLGVSREKIKRALHIDPEATDEEVSKAVRAAGKILRGKPFKADGLNDGKGTPYKPQYVERVWVAIEQLVADAPIKIPPKHKEAIRKRQGSVALEGVLMGGPAFTPTGRIRSACTYTAQRNTPFQGLAADGMKLALWRLYEQGFRVLNSIHDEGVVELPADEAEQLAPRVNAIFNEAMDEVLGGHLPSATKSKLNPYWTKD